MSKVVPTTSVASLSLRAAPLTRPVKNFMINMVRLHTASFMDLCLDDLTDDQDRLQRYCDQLALVTGLKLSFTYGSIQYANSAFVTVETNAPGAGFALVILTTLCSCFDLVAVLLAVLLSNSLGMVNSEEQLLYLSLACKNTMRLPFQVFWAASYTFAAAFLCESYVRCMGLDAKLADVDYEGYDGESVLSSLAFRGWLAGALAWMLPMPIVHAPIAQLLSYLYQSKTLMCTFDEPPPAPSEHPDWFAEPDANEVRALLDEYFATWGAAGTAGRFRNATPGQFLMFVLHRMRAKGHGSLSYLATRRVEAVFDERIEELLTEKDENPVTESIATPRKDRIHGE